MAPELEARGDNLTQSRYRAETPGTWLRLPCCQGSVHPVRILDRDNGTVTVTVPSEPHASWIKPPAGLESITLGYTDPGGTILLECVPVPDAISEDTWTLRVIATGDFVQRRRHVRVSSDATVRLMGQRDAGVVGEVMDISESGMRCMFKDYIPQRFDNPFMWALDLGDQIIAVTCLLRWGARVGPVDYEAGFEFIDGEVLATQLRTYIISQINKNHGA